MALWVVSTVVASVIGVLVSLNVDAVRGWWSEQDPLLVHVTPSGGSAPSSFSLVVEEPSRLPTHLDGVDDCSELWRIGLDAHGVMNRVPRYRILAQGVAEGGTVIVEMRARITRRAPAKDGALLQCTSAGGLEPIGLSFDLRKSDSVSAQRRQGDDVSAAFADGYAIGVARDESVPLMVEARMPADAVYWHIEADVIVGRSRRTLVINDDGKDFYSPGSRGLNQYSKGYGAGAEPAHWGIDRGLTRVDHARLRYGPVLLPFAPGIDIYQPWAPDEVSVSERWVRHDGRKLLSFNPPGVGRRRPLPAVGDLCGDLDGAMDNAHVGVIRSLTSQVEIRMHGHQKFAHLVGKYICSFDGENGYRDGVAGTDEFWNCGGVPCPEEKEVLRTVFRLGYEPMLQSVSNEVGDSDRALVDRLLNEVLIVG